MTRATALRWLLRLASFGMGVGAMVLVAEGASTSLVTASTSATLAWAAAIGLLFAAGTVPGITEAEVALWAALAWSAPVVIGWHDGPDWARSVGAVAAPLLLPALAQAALPGAEVGAGRRGPAARAVVAAGWAAFVAVTIAIALVRDPILVADCWNNCQANVFLVASSPVWARALEALAAVLAIGLAAATLLVVVGRWARHHRPPRATTAAASLALLVAVTMTVLSATGAPDAAPLPAFAVAESVGLAAFAAAALTHRAGRLKAGRAVDRIAADLLEGDGLRTVLAARLGDPDLVVLFTEPQGDRLLGIDGSEQPAPAAGRRITQIRRGDEVLAVVVHGRERSPIDGSDVDDLIGAAARLAIDNERLRAGIRANLRDLQRSRLAVIDAADAERIVIERNLHDGAQQSLVALGYVLGAAARGGSGADPAWARRLDEAQAVAGRLRAIAHGIWPAVLGDLGLVAALERLAEDGDRPIRVEARDLRRHPPVVERTAYLAAAASVSSAVGDDAVRIGLDVGDGEALRLVVDGGADPGQVVRDRVTASGGRIRIGSSGVEVVIPCE